MGLRWKLLALVLTVVNINIIAGCTILAPVLVKNFLIWWKILSLSIMLVLHMKVEISSVNRRISLNSDQTIRLFQAGQRFLLEHIWATFIHKYWWPIFTMRCLVLGKQVISSNRSSSHFPTTSHAIVTLIDLISDISDSIFARYHDLMLIWVVSLCRILAYGTRFAIKLLSAYYAIIILNRVSVFVRICLTVGSDTLLNYCSTIVVGLGIICLA
mgnify:CR=1 FL=1